MPTFQYEAVNAAGKEQKGVIEAPDRVDAQSQLKDGFDARPDSESPIWKTPLKDPTTIIDSRMSSIRGIGRKKLVEQGVTIRTQLVRFGASVDGSEGAPTPAHRAGAQVG